MWWAGDAPAGSPAWQTWLPTLIGVLITATGGLFATVWVKRMNRRLDEASAGKADAESAKALAETESTLVGTARGMVSEIRAMMVDQRETYEGQITMLRDSSTAQIDAVKVQHRADMKAIADRLGGIEQAFRTHRDWDDRATTILRQVDATFPDPPPVRFD